MKVVSTNWRDDYLIKLGDYEALGIPEYWIADYLGTGGRRYIGTPKQPTFTVCMLVDNEYDWRQFRSDQNINSQTFPGLALRGNDVFRPGQWVYFGTTSRLTLGYSGSFIRPSPCLIWFCFGTVVT